MWPVNEPNLNAQEVFIQCVRGIRNLELKGRLKRLLRRIGTASQRYRAAAEESRLHEIPPTTDIGNVTGKELVDVYKRMSKEGSSARHIYDEIKMSVPNNRCPLCGQRLVTTLDHFLPKAHYSLFSVAPINLVPACSDCNKTKNDIVLQSNTDAFLHPYFDDVDDLCWLNAEVVETTPAAVRFFVDAPPAWGVVLRERVQGHFSRLKLGVLYSTEAANEITNIRYRLGELHFAGTSAAVTTWLSEVGRSCENAQINGWRTATYRALANSNWFCDGGFRDAP